MKAYAFWGIITLAVLFLFIWIGADIEEDRIERVRKYEKGELIRIEGLVYSVTKKFLANDKCYYVYQGDRRSFTIPCEEKK